MNQTTREQVLEKLRRRYKTAGAEHKGKLLDQAVQLLGYHRKAAIRALGRRAQPQGPRIITGRPVEYEASLLVPWLRPIGGARVCLDCRAITANPCMERRTRLPCLAPGPTGRSPNS